MSGHKSTKKGSNIICRVSNVTPEMVCSYVKRMPKQKMKEDAFRDIMGKSWFQNEHQAPEQWGLYYIDGTYYYPRFDHDITIGEAEAYLYHWMRNLIVINPYTRFKKQCNKNLVESIVGQLEKNPNEHDLKTIIGKIIDSDEPFVINEIIANALNNYSRVLKVETINKDNEQFNVSLIPNYKEILKAQYNMTKKEYFELFDSVKTTFDPNTPIQQIYYGAPGTGKSHKIKDQIKKHKSFRITFHPDTDYSSFVGAYKPTSVEVPMLTTLGEKAIPVKDMEGNPLTENKIIYTYVKQAFLNAYIEAWKEQANETPQPVYLVIEEINRGNCAQIFGDIFQLLDRNTNGFSDYAIVPDADLSRHVKKDLEKLVIANRDAINAIYEECEEDMVEKVVNGKVLLLPNNLYIWATMNTSDQSLFPIDSAFKRRWDWKYIKIADAHKNWQIKVDTKTYDWWQFVQAINYFVFDATQSEDKSLGYFFAKAKDRIINAETFVSKVIFYLYTDVFKDYGFSGDIFKGVNDDEMTFQSFYNADGSPCEAQIIRFIENVMFSDALPDDLKANSLEESLEQTEGTLKFKVGDKYPVPQRQLAVTALKQFVDKYPNLTAKDVIDEWKSLSNVSHFIESQVDHDNTIANAPSRINRTEKVDLSNGDSVYISLHGWIPSTSTDLMNAINAKDWGIEVTIISE